MWLSDRALPPRPPLFSPHRLLLPGCRGWPPHLPVGPCIRTPAEPAPMPLEGACQMGVLCGGSEPPPSGEGGSGRPGPLPLAREAFSLGLVGLDGRHSCRRPSYCQQFCPHSLVRPASPHSDGEPDTCGRGAVCTVGVSVQNQVAGSSAGEKSIMRPCMFLERLFCGFRIQPRTASLCQQGA